ncbi:asialoglycoprotein receptor 2-like [Cherax quadricarinatus]|uniref:asialoglycoprotein receptor 2-like n=1 Tax=Cherax quadricarinatus TaxID=27406 RepID=UPI00387EDC71
MSATMKAIVVFLCVVGLASCQFFPPRQNFDRFPSRGSSGRFPSQGSAGRFPSQGSAGRFLSQGATSGVQADDTFGGSQYYFSWKHDGGKEYTGSAAASLCSSLGGGWQAVGISSQEELNYIHGIIGRERLDYIWTGGNKSGSSFKWLNGEPFSVTGWSHTGGLRKPQPDNREGGKENCLAILNNFYKDGIKWHDVACHHLKPVICERRA